VWLWWGAGIGFEAYISIEVGLVIICVGSLSAEMRRDARLCGGLC